MRAMTTKAKDKADQAANGDGDQAATVDVEAARDQVDPAFLAARDLLVHLAQGNPTAHTAELVRKLDVSLGLAEEPAADAEAGK
jgi:hypothetical protein